jgi:AraC-like DNA-binding protein
LHDPANSKRFVRVELAPAMGSGYGGAMEPLEELRLLVTRHAESPQAAMAAGIKAVTADAPSEIAHHVLEPMLAVVAQGAKRAVLGDKIFEYGAGQYLVVSVDLPIAGHVFQASRELPYLAAGFTLKPTTIATLLLELAANDRPSLDEPAGLGVSNAPRELLESVVRMLRLLDRPRDAAVLGPMLEREILWWLLNGEQGATVRQIGLADSRLSQVSRAIRWIRVHHAEPFRIEELAEMAAMSASSFHRHFRAVTTMSPLQYQKLIRLQEARSRLLAASQDIAAVGLSVGYDSPSQFSREYSRLFGAPPGRDVARLRTVSMAQPSPV